MIGLEQFTTLTGVTMIIRWALFFPPAVFTLYIRSAVEYIEVFDFDRGVRYFFLVF